MNIITTKEQLQEFVNAYSQVDAFAFDVETIGPDDFSRLHPLLNEVVWISFATEGRTDVIPMGHPNGEFLHWDKPLLSEGLRRQEAGEELKEEHYSKRESSWKPVFSDPPEQLFPGDVFAALKPLFFSDKLKVGHNIKFDIKAIAKYYRGKVISKPYFDTLIASFIIDNRTKNGLSLDACADRELGIVVEKGVGKEVEAHSFTAVATYAGIDAEVTWKLYQALEPQLRERNLQTVWHLEMDLLEVLSDMELAGAHMDTEELQRLRKQIEKDLVVVTGEAYKLAGKEFNLNSIPDKQQVLFTPKSEGGRGIRPNKAIKIALTPKGHEAVQRGEEITEKHYSVSAEALEYYREKDALKSFIWSRVFNSETIRSAFDYCDCSCSC